MATSESVTPRVASYTNLLDDPDSALPPGATGLQSSSVGVPKISSLMPQHLSNPATRSMYAMNKKPSNELSPEEQFLAKLAPTAVGRSAGGKVEFKDLFIPPPPAPSLENLLGITSSTEDVKTSDTKDSIKTDKTSPKGSPSHAPTDTSTVAKRRSTHSRGEKKTSLSPKKSKTDREKEKLMKVRQEKYAVTGKYNNDDFDYITISLSYS